MNSPISWFNTSSLRNSEDFKIIPAFTRFNDEFDDTDQVHIGTQGKDLFVVCYDDDSNYLNVGYSGNTTVGFKFEKQKDGTYKVFRLNNEITVHTNADELDQAKTQLQSANNLIEITDPSTVAKLTKALLNTRNLRLANRRNFTNQLDNFIRDTFLPGHMAGLKSKVEQGRPAEKVAALSTLVEFINACSDDHGTNLDEHKVLKDLKLQMVENLALTTIDDETFQSSVIERINGLYNANIKNKRAEALKKAGLDAFKSKIDALAALALAAAPGAPAAAATALDPKALDKLKPLLTLTNPTQAFKVGNSIYAASFINGKLNFQVLKINDNTIERSEPQAFDQNTTNLSDIATTPFNPDYDNILAAFNKAKKAIETPQSMDTTSPDINKEREERKKVFNDLLAAEITNIDQEHEKLTALFGANIADGVAIKKLTELATNAGITTTKTTYKELLNEIKTTNPLEGIKSPDTQALNYNFMRSLVHLAGDNGIATQSEKIIINDIMQQIASHGGISQRQRNLLRSIFEKYNRTNANAIKLENFDQEIDELITASNRECTMQEYSQALIYNQKLFTESNQLNEFLPCLAGLNPTTLDFDYFNYSGDKIPAPIAKKYPGLDILITKCIEAGFTSQKTKEFMHRALMLAEATSNNSDTKAATSSNSVTDESIEALSVSKESLFNKISNQDLIKALHNLPANTDQTDIRRFTFFTELLTSSNPEVQKLIKDIDPNDRDLSKKLEALAPQIMAYGEQLGYSHIFNEVDPVENYKVKELALENIVNNNLGTAFEIAQTLGFTEGNPQSIQDVARIYGCMDGSGVINNQKLVAMLEQHMNNFFNTYSQSQRDPGATVANQIDNYHQVFIRLTGILNSGIEGQQNSNILAEPPKQRRITPKEFSRSLYNYLKFLSGINPPSLEQSSSSINRPRRGLIMDGVTVWA